MIYSNFDNQEQKYINPLEKVKLNVPDQFNAVKSNMTAEEIGDIISEKLIKKVKEELAPELEEA